MSKPIKIAFIVSEFPTLSETFILNQITGLLDLGHDVEIFAHLNPGEKKMHPDIGKYRIMERVRYFSVPPNRIKRVFKVLYIVMQNIHKHPKIILNTLNFFKYGKEALSLYLFYDALPFLLKDFDIIHCHFGPNGIKGIRLKELGIKSKIITTFHGYDMSSFIANNSGIYSDLFLKGDLFLPISDHWGKKLVELGCDETKIKVHRMGIDLKRFHYLARTIQSGEPVRILTIGRLTEKKGHRYAIEAIARVLKKHKNVEYKMAGDGPLRKDLENLVSKLAIEYHVQFLGAVEQEEVLRLYQGSHIFLLPSVTARDGDQEGIPVVLMEAQATGMPVVSTFHSGIPEVVLDGTSGFLVPEKDSKTLGERIEYLIENQEEWPALGKRGREFIEQRYDIHNLNRQLVEIYNEMLIKGEMK